MRFIGCLIVLLAIKFGCGNKFSNFRKTEVFDEVLDVGLKTTIDGVALMTCAKTCSDDVDCRRVKFCEDDHVSGQCKMYEDGKDCPHEADGRECTCFQKMRQCEDANCACAIGLYGNSCEKVIKDCSEGKNHGLENLKEKLSYIQPDGAEEPFEVLCEFQHGGLTVIQSRKLAASYVDFNRSLEEYVQGFGRPRYNYWLGLKHISLLFAAGDMKCNIMMTYESDFCQVYYDRCHVGNETDGYKITISDYSTSFNKLCGNSLTAVDNINNAPFSTYDSDSSGYNCTSKMAAGWWYAPTTNCTQGNLNAPLVASPAQGNVRLKWILDKGDTTFTSSVFRITAL
ncbi:angiopoietin-1-like [Haliotis rubra]|uniref:angiopoietin-1-like n=1 Tax=Haliotis rubra TaxID=36100 RepID=UPI001EE5EE0C|nr:angiopoietin-1-like [Haliotis rubra]